MKNKSSIALLLVGILLVGVLAGLGFSGYFGRGTRAQNNAPYIDQAPAQPAMRQDTADIGEARAKQIALADAGLQEADVTFSFVKIDTEKGTPVYEIEFFHGATEYDYDVALASGEIMSKSVEQNAAPRTTPAQIAPTSNADIGKDAAIAAALEHAGLAQGDVTHLTAQLDYDDGMRVYEVEFYVGRTEYSYEIDAADGAVLDFEMDND